MSQIKCPNCGTVFQVDESQYHEILQQVRNEEFEKELNERQKNSNQIIQSKLEKEYEAKLSQKALEIKELWQQRVQISLIAVETLCIRANHIPNEPPHKE